MDQVAGARVVVVGGGQAGLAAGYFLRRAGLVAGRDFVILDRETEPGGAWQHAWTSLRLFSPSGYSSLPGWPMPTWSPGFPAATHVVDYLRRYEERYELPVRRGVTVTAVRHGRPGEPRFQVETSAGTWTADAVISATGTWRRPFVPTVPGRQRFTGRQMHTADYRDPTELAGQRVVIVGGGNSAAQLLAEISTVAQATWVTARPPRYLPDDVDGRVLFDLATARTRAPSRHQGVGELGDIVMVPSVVDARRRGALRAEPMFTDLEPDGISWPDGRTARADTIVWCTGFRPDLGHLTPLRLARGQGHPRTDGTQTTSEPRVHLLGYGDWTGTASATLIGVGRTARAAVQALEGSTNSR